MLIDMKPSAPLDLKGFLQELLLYSGQFALFYLLMQVIVEQGGFLRDTNHLLLLATLVAQSLWLAAFGNRAVLRVVGTFLVPVVYSLMEMLEGATDVLNAAHVGFWVYAVVSSAFMSLKLRSKKTVVYEILSTVVNVAIFVFLYFYFDTSKENPSQEDLVVTRIFLSIPTFLSDPTHWFVIFGGAFLAVTLALARVEIDTLKARIYSLFGKYVDSEIRDLIIQRGVAASEKKELCVVFSDIRNFTKLCEQNNPETITTMLNAFFDEWNLAVKRHSGVVDKYMGDAIMILFGLQNPSQACDSAVQCATDMIHRWDELRRSLASNGLPVPEGFGVGVHFGEVIVGDIGSSDRRNFTVIGDAVNVASRLESETKTHAQLLISAAVFERLSPDLKSRFIDPTSIELKGKEQRIVAYSYREAP